MPLTRSTSNVPRWSGRRRHAVVRSTLRVASCVASLVASLVAASPARAQLRQTRDNLNGWINVVGDLRLSERWYLDYDPNLRLHGPYREMQQLLPRFGLRFQPNSALRFNWGYAFAETWPYGKLPVPFRFPEHRMWEQVQLHHAAGRVALNHRYRLEQRWVGRVVEEGGEEHVEAWVRTNRFRYRIQATLPLRGKTLDDGEFYVTANDEVFLNWGANVQYNVLDQNRIVLALGHRLSPKLRVEAGYLQQLIAKGSGRELERNHTILVSVLPSHSLWRPATR